MARGETMAAERRRRNTDALEGKRRKLAVQGELDRENFSYRWVNDEGTRLHDLTVSDDWEVVPDRRGTLKVDGTGTGAEVSVPVGTGEHGRPVRAVLLRKRKDWYDGDKLQEQRRIDEQEDAIRSSGTKGEQTYTPTSGVSISHGSKS